MVLDDGNWRVAIGCYRKGGLNKSVKVGVLKVYGESFKTSTLT